MIVEVWEVYSGDDCIACVSKKIADKQIILYPIDHVSKTGLDLSEIEIEELETKGYIWA